MFIVKHKVSKGMKHAMKQLKSTTNKSENIQHLAPKQLAGVLLILGQKTQ